jgi:hypothetical protein
MKLLLLPILLLLSACASRPVDPNQSPPPTKAEIEARDNFARDLPKPPER